MNGERHNELLHPWQTDSWWRMGCLMVCVAPCVMPCEPCVCENDEGYTSGQ